MTSQETYLSAPQAAARLRAAGLAVNARQVRRWVGAGKLPAIELPNGRAQIKTEDVDALLDTSAAGAAR